MDAHVRLFDTIRLAARPPRGWRPCTPVAATEITPGPPLFWRCGSWCPPDFFTRPDIEAALVLPGGASCPIAEKEPDTHWVRRSSHLQPRMHLILSNPAKAGCHEPRYPGSTRGSRGWCWPWQRVQSLSPWDLDPTAQLCANGNPGPHFPDLQNATRALGVVSMEGQCWLLPG